MKFIRKWSYACASGLATAREENRQKRLIYYYSLQVIIGAIFKGIVTILLALLLGIFVPMMFIILVFVSLRMLAGGYHMDTYVKCLVVSISLFVAAALISQYTYTHWSLMCVFAFIAMTFIFGLYVLVRYAPRDTPNKPITDPKEIRKFKTLSILHLFVWLVVTVFLTYFKLKLYVISLCFGVLLELFVITPTGHKFFDWIKHGLNRKTRTNRRSLCE